MLLKWYKHAPFSPNLKKKQSVNKSKKHKTPSQKSLVTGNKSDRKQASKKKGTPDLKSTNKKTKEKQPTRNKNVNSKKLGGDRNQMFNLFAEFLSFYNSKK